MVQSDTPIEIAPRVFLVAFGAIAAFCLWVLADSWGADVLGARAFLALFSFSAVFFGVALALTGPVPVRRALVAALALAVPVAGLISWAGLRYDDAGQFLDDGKALAVAGVLVVLATPFLSVWMMERARALDYAALFDTAWTITVRYAAGWVFVGVFWIVVFLSNALLELVDIDVIEVLFEVDWVRFALSGAALGLGLAVAWELRDYVSPHLFLRLLRLLLPILLVVVVVFVLALPLRGLSGLFGDFSSAATLMGVTIAAISLISIALDRDDHDGINTRGMKAAARGLAMLAPILSALAFWAVVIRVRQYGWTPDRVMAGTAAGVLLTYGVTYAVAALRGRGWRQAIRGANVYMALLTLMVAILWLTPVLNADRIAAQSQVKRFTEGRTSVDQLPLWHLQAEWGRAGRAALTQMEALADHPMQGPLAERMEALREADSRYAFEQGRTPQAVQTMLDLLIARMPVRPEGAITLTAEMFAEVPDYRLSQWSDGCAMGQGEVPGCVWISGAFVPGMEARDQAVVLFETGTRTGANFVSLQDGLVGTRIRDLYDPATGAWSELPPGVIAQVISGRYNIVPSGVQALQIDGLRLIPAN